MLFNKFDSYYYSRPVSYRSYNPRLTRPQILKNNDADTLEVLNLMRERNIEATDLGGLARGIRFSDFQVGKRHYNHNNYNVKDEYYIHQWKKTNDLNKEHSTGTHLVYKNYLEFIAKLIPILDAHKGK